MYADSITKNTVMFVGKMCEAFANELLLKPIYKIYIHIES